ncbi:MAG: hypothetical protein PWP03_262, partial [Candidatus Woesearchaeota archaeon]|nr:hypothetical protein [Candidatus Woesearchaeota archaeon]
MNSFPSSQDINKRKVFFLIAILVLVLVVVYADIIYFTYSTEMWDPCSDDQPCDEGYVCYNGACTRECTNNNDCGGYHIASPYMCVDNSAGYEYSYCEGGYCKKGFQVSKSCSEKEPYYKCNGNKLEYYIYTCEVSESPVLVAQCVDKIDNTIDCSDYNGWYCKEGYADIKEYRRYFCDETAGACNYSTGYLEDINCSESDGWYCNGNTREYRDYYCDDSERDCKYRVDESYNCK